MDRSRTLPTAPTVRLLHYPDLASGGLSWRYYQGYQVTTVLCAHFVVD